MILFIIAVIIEIIVIVPCAIFSRPSPKRRRRSRSKKKYKGLIGLANDMERSRKKRGRHLMMP